MWPAPGSDRDTAYFELVEKDGNKLKDYLDNLNDSTTTKISEYLHNHSIRNQIMQNFARVTVYIKSTTVQQIEEVPAYPILSLLSDLGNIFL